MISLSSADTEKIVPCPTPAVISASLISKCIDGGAFDFKTHATSDSYIMGIILYARYTVKKLSDVNLCMLTGRVAN